MDRPIDEQANPTEFDDSITLAGRLARICRIYEFSDMWRMILVSIFS